MRRFGFSFVALFCLLGHGAVASAQGKPQRPGPKAKAAVRLIMNGDVIGTFDSVRGLEAAGGRAGSFTVTLKTGFGKPALAGWYERAQAHPRTAKRDVRLALIGAGVGLGSGTSYALSHALPTKIEFGPPQAGRKGVMMETVVIVCERIVRARN